MTKNELMKSIFHGLYYVHQLHMIISDVRYVVRRPETKSHKNVISIANPQGHYGIVTLVVMSANDSRTIHSTL